MKVYLVSRYSRREQLQEIAKLLISFNISVTSRWLTEDHNLPDAQSTENARKSIHLKAEKFAREDIEDIDSCDVLVLFSERVDTQVTREGCHVAFGYALGTGKRIIICGPRSHVFHTLTDIYHCDELPELCLLLKDLEKELDIKDNRDLAKKDKKKVATTRPLYAHVPTVHKSTIPSPESSST